MSLKPVPSTSPSEPESSRVYWADFYAHHAYGEGSTFFAFVHARPDTPATVLDIGCGDGRDARAFAAGGRRVLGLDQSDVGVEHAAAQAAAAGLTGVTFAVCDVADTAALDDRVGAALQAADGPVLFYLRFFLHAIPAEAQDGLMGVLARRARPGDMFAAEFRTDKDEQIEKVHGGHYRRFQSAAEFGRRLVDDYGFVPLFEQESAGLSPYRGEDPVLYRVVARRP